MIGSIIEAKNNDYAKDVMAITIILHTTMFKDQVNLIVFEG